MNICPACGNECDFAESIMGEDLMPTGECRTHFVIGQRYQHADGTLCAKQTVEMKNMVEPRLFPAFANLEHVKS